MTRPPSRLWRRAQRRLGPFGLAALALLVPTLLLAAWLPRLNRESEQLRTAWATQAAHATRPAPAAPSRVPVGQQIGEFVAAFPLLAQSANDLDEVFRSAARHHLQLLRGEYQLKHDAQAPLSNYTVTLPVRSEYGAVKDFAADVLRALPNASLDELRMSRADAGSTVLESVVRFTFVYRSER
ncbi:hypothetical protein BH11PSE8_BH11PSE8_39960 [soil metagenome]